MLLALNHARPRLGLKDDIRQRPGKGVASIVVDRAYQHVGVSKVACPIGACCGQWKEGASKPRVCTREAEVLCAFQKVEACLALPI